MGFLVNEDESKQDAGMNCSCSKYKYHFVGLCDE